MLYKRKPYLLLEYFAYEHIIRPVNPQESIKQSENIVELAQSTR